MTKVLLAFPKWDNRWIPYFTKELSKYDLKIIHSDDFMLNTLWDETRKADILISMWATEIPQFWAHYFPDKKIITYLRRYEFFQESYMERIRWISIDAVIFVNETIKRAFEVYPVIKQPRFTYYIPNAVDLQQFHLTERDPSEPKSKIAFVCSSIDHKNFGLAIQILLSLDDKYTIHYIGKASKERTNIYKPYLDGLGIGERWIWCGKIPASDMPEWYADKHFILSTSITEGNPNNVIEGMACGLKPIVHHWAGANEQFPGFTFSTVDEAVKLITSEDYEPLKYRWIVDEKYSLANIAKIHDVIEDICRIP